MFVLQSICVKKHVKMKSIQNCHFIPTFTFAIIYSTKHKPSSNSLLFHLNLIKVEESYTSKLCLNINNIGSEESYTCKKCPEENKVTVDRDESASRAIYYRTVHRFSL